MRAEIAITAQRQLNARRDSYLCAEIAVFVLNLSDIIFLRTAPQRGLSKFNFALVHCMPSEMEHS